MDEQGTERVNKLVKNLGGAWATRSADTSRNLRAIMAWNREDEPLGPWSTSTHAPETKACAESAMAAEH